MQSKTGYDHDLEIDARGVRCPVTLVKLAESMRLVEIGGVVKTTATDPACGGDIGAWAKVTGNELIDVVRDGDEVTVWVRRTV